MYNFFQPFLSLLVGITSFTYLNADIPSSQNQDESSLQISENASSNKTIEPFTGKVTRNKVRMRLQPSLDAPILRELNRDDLLSVMEEYDEFYAVLPPKELKAYIFRTFVLDDIVEGSKVNVRLEPALEAPIIAQLQQGERVEGSVSALNSKWLEITPPESTRFYVCKEYVEKVGPVEMIEQLEKRLGEANTLINSARIASESELQKPYKEIDLDIIIAHLNKIVKQYGDFPSHVASAKELLNNIQSEYLEKKIAYLESKAGEESLASQTLPLFSNIEKESSPIKEKEELDVTKAAPQEDEPYQKLIVDWHSLFDSSLMPDKMAQWIPYEKALYERWKRPNTYASIEEFYRQQLNDTVSLQGIMEMYPHPIKNKPGDYILVDPGTRLPIAYLYSTRVNLNDYIQQEVIVHGLRRDNRNFAFPAYYVISVE